MTVSVGSQVAMTELRRRSTPMPGLAEAWLTGDGEHINARTSLLEGMVGSTQMHDGEGGVSAGCRLLCRAGMTAVARSKLRLEFQGSQWISTSAGQVMLKTQLWCAGRSASLLLILPCLVWRSIRHRGCVDVWSNWSDAELPAGVFET